MRRAEARARAEAAVDAIIARNTDPWERYLKNQRLQKAKNALPGQIAKARARLAQLEAEAIALGLEMESAA